MELKDILKIAKQNILFILTITILGAAIGLLSTRFLESGFEKSQYFFLKEESPAFQEASIQENLTESATQILKSPDFTRELAQVPFKIEATKIAPYVVRVTVISQTTTETEQILAIIPTKFNSKIQELVPQGRYLLVSVGNPPETSHNVLNSKILAIVGAILGLVLSLVTLSVYKFFKL